MDKKYRPLHQTFVQIKGFILMLMVISTAVMKPGWCSRKQLEAENVKYVDVLFEIKIGRLHRI